MALIRKLAFIYVLIIAETTQAASIIQSLLAMCKKKTDSTSSVKIDEVPAVAPKIIKEKKLKSPGESALTSHNAQDEQNYYFKALLRREDTRKKITSLADELFAEFKLKNPKATADEEALFLKDLNKMLSWKISDDSHFQHYADEVERYVAKMGEGSLASFEKRVNAFFEDSVGKAKSEENKEFVKQFLQKAAEHGIIRENKVNDPEWISDYQKRLDALSLIDPMLSMYTKSKMKKSIAELERHNPYEQRESLKEIDAFFSSHFSYHNFDAIPQAAVSYVNDDFKLLNKDKTKNPYLWLKDKADGITPLIQDKKSFFNFVAERIKSLETPADAKTGYLAKEDLFAGRESSAYPTRGLGSLLVSLDGKTPDELSRAPWDRHMAEAFADHIVFRRLKVLKPELAKEAPNIIIPDHILNFVIDSQLFSRSRGSQPMNPRFREFDDEFFSTLDERLEAYFSRKP
ncbi:MAG: hypothetical protein KA116_00345 [Proteobacteria bacterium]|nr:hypothetical protein [Pseudomonadota bacterium]